MQMHSLIDPAVSPDSAAATVDRLQAVARALSCNALSAEARNLDRELVALVEECLQDCRDGILLQALSALRSEAQAHDLLRQQVETASASAQVQTGGGAGMAQLYAIPVLLSNDRPLGAGRLPVGAAFQLLASSIRDAGLVHPEASVILGDYLYHPTELQALWPSEVRRLPASLVANLQPADSDGPRKGMAALGRSGWPSDALPGTASSGVQLRYLLVTATRKSGAEDASGPASADRHERLPVLRRWTDDAGSALAGLLGLSADALIVLTFAPYAQALRAGFDCLRQARLCSSLEPFVDCRVHARALSVTLGFCGDSGEECRAQDATAIRLLATSSLRDDGSVMPGRSLEHHYPVFGKSDAVESLARLATLLADAGIRRIWVVKQPPPDFRSELRDGPHDLVRSEPGSPRHDHTARVVHISEAPSLQHNRSTDKPRHTGRGLGLMVA